MQENEIVLITFVGVIILMALLIIIIAAILHLYQKKQHSFLNQLEIVKNRYEKEILSTQLEVQEETLQHISREVHDNIGQFLTLAKLHLNTIEAGPEGLAKVDYAVDLVGKALNDLRDLSKSLSLELIREVGLAKAIENLVSQLKKAGRYEVNFEIRGDDNYFDEKKEIIMFRVLQESINNILRHSKASSIWIMLDYSKKAISMSVKDDGIGFDTEKILVEGKPYRRTGGISHMMARAMLIEADFIIESKRGDGTLVRITVPINYEYEPI